MHWYHRIICLLDQLPSCNTPKGTLKSIFHVEYKSVNSDLANDAQNGIFKTLPLQWGRVSASGEGCRGGEFCVSTASNTSCYIYCSAFPGMFCLVLKRTKNVIKRCCKSFSTGSDWSDLLVVTEHGRLSARLLSLLWRNTSPNHFCNL